MLSNTFPSIFVPLSCLVVPAVTMAIMFVRIESEQLS